MVARDPTGADNAIAIRAVWLALLAAAANLWCLRHLGRGFDNPVALLGLTGGVAGFSFAMDFLVDKSERERLRAALLPRIQRILRHWLLATPVLCVLTLLALVAALVFGSITVIPPSHGGIVLAITPLDDPDHVETLRLSAGKVSGPRLLVTNPFGRELRLSATGYEDTTRTLFPLVGLTVDVGREFDALPTLLLRPRPEALAALRNGGHYRVSIRTAEGCKTVADSQGQGVAGAVTLGVQRQIPPALPVLWNLELQSAGLGGANLATTLLAWHNPAALAVPAVLANGTGLRVEIVSAGGRVMGLADVTVGRDAFQDVPMHDVTGTPPPCTGG